MQKLSSWQTRLLPAQPLVRPLPANECGTKTRGSTGNSFKTELCSWLVHFIAGQPFLSHDRYFASVAGLHSLCSSLVHCMVIALHVWPIYIHCTIRQFLAR